MIHHSLNERPFAQRIGIQKSNRHYTYLHWRGQGSTDKFKYLSHSEVLKLTKYRPIGPTMLVEWTDE